MSIIFVVRLDHEEVDKFSITKQKVPFDNEPVTQLNELHTSTENNVNPARKHSQKSQKCVRLFLDGYCFSCVKNLLKTSPHWRCRVIVNFCLKHPNTRIIVQLIEPQQHILDYKWAKIIDRMVVERRELDNSFSWMSTLGGAYSALGDYIPNFAVIAGKISVRQLELAVRLGDTPVVIRCCLYYALSLIQQAKLRQARTVIETQYMKAKQLPIDDIKLINICKGIWSRLRYEWELKKRKRKDRIGPA